MAGTKRAIHRGHLQKRRLTAKIKNVLDAPFANQGRLEYPHLWIRATRLALDVERFDADRRSDAVRDRSKTTFGVG